MRSRYVRGRRGFPARPSGEELLLALFFLVAVSCALFMLLLEWLLAHRWAAGLTVVSFWCCWRMRARARRRKRQRELQQAQFDAMHHMEFEYAVRDLLRRDGCVDAARTGGRGDLGADVIATDPSGRRWVVQCKHRRGGLAGSAVGTPDLQRLNGTARPVHRADVVVLVTNGRFTRDAYQFARSQGIDLVARERLTRWARSPGALEHLLEGGRNAPHRRLQGRG